MLFEKDDRARGVWITPLRRKKEVLTGEILAPYLRSWICNARIYFIFPKRMTLRYWYPLQSGSRVCDDELNGT